MRRAIALCIVVLTAGRFLPAASATPPTTLLIAEDHGRAQATGAAAVAVAPGSDLVIASYTLPPGADSGWWHRAGSSVLVVTGGTLTVRSAADCATNTYGGGQAAVLPPGLHRISNPGDQPVALTGAFLDAPLNGAAPFIGRAHAAPPTRCGRGAAQDLGRALTAASLIRSSHGAFVGPAAYGHSNPAHYIHGIQVEAGKDIHVASIRADFPGSGGWMHHRAAIGIVTKGTLTYYEGHEGRCVKTQFHAGQAYVHASPITHMPVNETSEVVEAIYVFFNLPHNAAPLPVISNLTDTIDWTPLPPEDCPRL